MVSLAFKPAPRLAVVDDDEVEDEADDDAVEDADADGGDSSTDRSQYELTFCPSSHTSR